jgi:serine/threonine protein phosphatase 1
MRVLAIGDVHGCSFLLDDLLGWVAPAADDTVVTLGDYVDRGPDSAGVLALLQGTPPVRGAQVVNLGGNHEQMMQAALDPRADEQVVGFWLDNGGAATLESYAADPRDMRSWAAVPRRDREWLTRLRPSLALGGYVLTHAGVRPGVPLDAQDPMDLAWIREPFLSWRGGLGAVVVHGHTPCDGPEVLDHRIGIDTGAVFGGPLTCAVLEDDRLGFLFA